MKKQKHVISRVLPDSIGEELGLEPGDILLEINGSPVEDYFDYRYLLNEEYVEVLIEKPNGEEWELEVEKEFEEDLGLEFESGLMDDYRSCSNRCIFCFIDQMPPGMRKTLYFKDDDSRLSVMQGNYVTLTNMSEHDIDRIIRYRLEPMNISFQTMNPELRCRMLRNRFAGKALEKVDRLYEAGISMNGQIVLCKGINDGAELEYSLEKLSAYAPVLESVSVVPVGLSKFREGLEVLEPFDRQDAAALIEQVERWQKKMYRKYRSHFVHASDEWYILAGRELPEEESYDGYLQLENGVGMLTLLLNEVKESLAMMEGDGRSRRISLATGKLAAPYIRMLLEEIQEKFPCIKAQVYEITNHFFGESITVSGLITGKDLTEQLSGRELGEQLLLPCNMLRSGEDVFLDDLTVGELEKRLSVSVQIVDREGEDLVKAVIGEAEPGNKKRRQYYE
ncbi:MAG: DUF512 domain-containing protein [Eubacteriales bacterium]|nr:DUF512 domain-containing protein [Eubacteriales bacterium]